MSSATSGYCSGSRKYELVDLSFASKFINATGSNADNIAIRAVLAFSEDSPAKRTNHLAWSSGSADLCGRDFFRVRFERLDILLSR